MNEKSKILALERVEIAGVRNINWADNGGPGLAFDLGQVTIVSAPNGVGKSSVIEALTLGLTGEGRRRGELLDQAAYVHARRPSETIFANVKLDFGAAGGLAWEEGQEPMLAQQATAALLSSDDSDLPRSPAAVANLLRLTHLLPQGWGERFTDHKGGTRWSLVERALGLDGTRDAIRAAQGKGTVGVALTRRVTDAARAHEEATDARTRWMDRAKDWTEAREAARGAGAVSPSETSTQLAEVAALLAVPAPFTLERLRIELEEKRLTLTSTLDAATRLHSKIQSADQEVAAVDAALRSATSAQEDAVANLAAARSVHLRALGAAAQAALPELRQALRQAEMSERAAKLLSDADTLERLGREVHEAEVRLAGTPDPDALGVLVQSATDTQAAAQRELDLAQSHLCELLRAHGELARILGELRPHIEHDAHEPRSCPVCDRPSPTLLEDLDHKLRAFGDGTTISARERLAAAEAAARLASQRCFEAQRMRETADATHAEADRARAALADELTLSTVLYPEYATTSDPQVRAAAMRSDASRLNRVDVDGAKPGLLVADARAQREAAALRLLEAEEAIRSAEASPALGTTPPTVDVTQHRLNVVERDVAEGERAVAAAEERLRQAHASRKALAVELGRLALPELAGVHLDELPARVEALRGTRLRALDGLLARLDAIQRGVEAYTRVGAVQRAEEALLVEARSAGFEPPEVLDDDWIDTISKHLIEREESAGQKARACSERKDRVTRWVRALSDELQVFEDECLKAMDPTVGRFLEALAPTMPWRLRLAKTRTSALTEFSNTDAPKVSPQTLLSEGEHTAVALAYLLAFHTRYRWSCWPALVLDDPFQAADVVRVGALLDLLRNLCIEQRTQLILTTHEPRLAEWAARKMRSAHIDTRHYELERTATGLAARPVGDSAGR